MELKNSHGDMAGPTLISQIQDQCDLAYDKYMEAARVIVKDHNSNLIFANGEVEGFVKSLAILRGSSTSEERKLAHQRYLAKVNAKDGVVG